MKLRAVAFAFLVGGCTGWNLALCYQLSAKVSACVSHDVPEVGLVGQNARSGDAAATLADAGR